ncbi:hypothetical protein BJ741DRAFT_667240 [Chytriomyces cf. hyalinus JEL632]|nr:hypothetical protein BJ741DRAFT_667240 [Chytriomyces cf. hyalinus JEL632]
MLAASRPVAAAKSRHSTQAAAAHTPGRVLVAAEGAGVSRLGQRQALMASLSGSPESLELLSTVAALTDEHDLRGDVHVAVTLQLGAHPDQAQIQEALQSVAGLLGVSAVDSLTLRLPQTNPSTVTVARASDTERAANILASRKSRKLSHGPSELLESQDTAYPKIWEALVEAVSTPQFAVGSLGVSAASVGELEGLIRRVSTHSNASLLHSVTIELAKDARVSDIEATDDLEALARSHGVKVCVSKAAREEIQGLSVGTDGTAKGASFLWIARYTVFSNTRSVAVKSGYAGMALHV